MFGSRKAKSALSATEAKDQDKKATPSAPVGAASPPAAPAQSSSTTGNAKSAPAESAAAISPQMRQRNAVAIRQSLAFSQIVTILMRSSYYKHLTLGDLEWLVLPPLLAGQFSVAQARAAQGAPALPAAVALWARVSPEVDKRLTASPNVPLRLRPDEWRSGDIYWLVDVVGDSRIVPQLMKKLGETVFKGRNVKMRTLGGDGKPVAKAMPPSANSADPAKVQ
jgi:cytolysin-activating lysine-acyltransferase